MQYVNRAHVNGVELCMRFRNEVHANGSQMCALFAIASAESFEKSSDRGRRQFILAEIVSLSGFRCAVSPDYTWETIHNSFARSKCPTFCSMAGRSWRCFHGGHTQTQFAITESSASAVSN